LALDAGDGVNMVDWPYVTITSMILFSAIVWFSLVRAEFNEDRAAARNGPPAG
jgi:hypothetical protein